MSSQSQLQSSQSIEIGGSTTTVSNKKKIPWLLIVQLISLVIGSCLLGILLWAEESDREWSKDLIRWRLRVLMQEAVGRENKTWIIYNLATRSLLTQFVGVLIVGFVDITLVVHIAIYYWYAEDNYRVTFGRLYNVTTALLHVVVIVLLLESMFRIDVNYGVLNRIAGFKDDPNITYFPLFRHCRIGHNTNGHPEPETALRKHNVCQRTDLKIAGMIMCGVNVFLLGAIAVLSKHRMAKLEEELENAPDLLYDTYNTEHIRVNVNFDTFHNAQEEGLLKESEGGVEEVTFGSMVFEVPTDNRKSRLESSSSVTFPDLGHDPYPDDGMMGKL